MDGLRTALLKFLDYMERIEDTRDSGFLYGLISLISFQHQVSNGIAEDGPH